MLVPLLMNLGIIVAPVNATAIGSLPTIKVRVMQPLWVSETPEDTIMVSPNPTPVGSFQ